MPPAKRHAALGSCGHGFTQQAPSPSLQTKLFRCATHDTLNERALIKQFVFIRNGGLFGMTSFPRNSNNGKFRLWPVW